MIKQDIVKQLQQHFTPVYLDVQNESYQHHVPAGAETHFNVVMVSDSFIGQRLVTRHRQVYSALAAQLAAGVHALALHLYTNDEWNNAQHSVPHSPQCRGGSLKE